MPRYLDPKNDLVFRRVFGEHPNVLRAMLNAVLPLPPDKRIVSLEYIPAELVPDIPLLKRTIVDVRCRDEQGRQFIVEMQMNWTANFLQRVLFSACQAYVRQLKIGEQYHLLQPVIGLSLLDDVFDRKTDEFLHHYEIVKRADTDSVIDGLQLVLVELPKFHPTGTVAARDLWLRYLIEIGKDDAKTDDLLGQSPELDEALKLSEFAAYTRAQLEWYDRFWDTVSRERTMLFGAEREGVARGRAELAAEILERLMAGGMSENDARKLIGL